MSRKPRTEQAAITSRPSVADALERARGTNKAKDNRQPGTVINGEDGLVYYWLDPTELKEGRLRKMRDQLVAKGYWKAEGGEYVAECSTAEIWATYYEVANENFEHRKRLNNEAQAVFKAGLSQKGMPTATP